MIVFIIIVTGTNQLFAQSDEEFRKTIDCLDNKNGEVYFQFTFNNQSELATLTNAVSIDLIDGYTVHAYANRKKFFHFLKSGLPYNVLLHPGYSQKDPPMSDYSDRGPIQIVEYPTYNGYLNLLTRFQSDFPTLCKIDTIGTSVLGKLILAAKISDNVNKNEMEPLISNTGGVHGDETLGFMFVLKLMDIFLNEYGKDEQITGLVDSLEFWFVPMINPDGVYRGGDNTLSGGTRSNANGVDLNRHYRDIISGSQNPEKENIVSMGFDTGHNFTFSLDFHSGGSCVGFPFCRTRKRPPDSLWYVQETRQYAEIVHDNSPSNYFNDFNSLGYACGYEFLPKCTWYQG